MKTEVNSEKAYDMIYFPKKILQTVSIQKRFCVITGQVKSLPFVVPKQALNFVILFNEYGFSFHAYIYINIFIFYFWCVCVFVFPLTRYEAIS